MTQYNCNGYLCPFLFPAFLRHRTMGEAQSFGDGGVLLHPERTPRAGGAPDNRLPLQGFLLDNGVDGGSLCGDAADRHG